MLGDSPWWGFELAGFLSGAFRPNAQSGAADDGLLLVHPYRPGRIPIVLVHGIASSPAPGMTLGRIASSLVSLPSELTLPIAPGIAANSIIAVDDTDEPDDASDSVVRYSSAHIEGVESEKIIRSGHSAQGNPSAIEEIRRILLRHLQETELELSPPARSP